MRKIALSLVLLAAGSGFLMGSAKQPSAPQPGTYDYCWRVEVENGCAQFGNGWAPNNQYQIDPLKPWVVTDDGFLTQNFKKDANGNLVLMPVCAPGVTSLCYDPTKVSYDGGASARCHYLGNQACKARYGR